MLNTVPGRQTKNGTRAIRPCSTRYLSATLQMKLVTKSSKALLRVGIVGHYPEFKGFLDDQERYNKGGYIDKLLRLFDYEDIYINRKGDEKPLVITDAFMCILGDIQPALLAPTFGNPQYMVSGLNTRFLFTMPKIFEFPDREKESMNPCFVESWRSIIRQAYDNDYH